MAGRPDDTTPLTTTGKPSFPSWLVPARVLINTNMFSPTLG
jgi:hypothetical protein